MSTTRRVYLPLGLEELRSLREHRELPGASIEGFAVTDAVRKANVGVDDEEVHEYGATQDAAHAARAVGAPVVGAADLAEGIVDDGGTDARVVVRGPLPLKRFASFHLIDGDSSAEQPNVDIELSWFDATELALLLDVIGSA